MRHTRAQQRIADMQRQQLQHQIAQIEATKLDLETAEDVSSFLTSIFNTDEQRLTFLNALGGEFLRSKISEENADNDYFALFQTVAEQHRPVVATLIGINHEAYQRLNEQLQIAMAARAEEEDTNVIYGWETKEEEKEEETKEEEEEFADAADTDPTLPDTFSQILTLWHTAEREDKPQWLEQLRTTFDELMATAQNDADVQARNLAAIFNALHAQDADFHPYQLLNSTQVKQVLPNFATWLEEGGNVLALARYLRNKQLAVLSSDKYGRRPSQGTINAFLDLNPNEQQRMLRNFPTRMQSMLRDACWRSTSQQRSSQYSAYFADRHLRCVDNRYDAILPDDVFSHILKDLRNTLKKRYSHDYTGTEHIRDYLGHRNYLSTQRWLEIVLTVNNAQCSPNQEPIFGVGIQYARGDKEALRTGRFGKTNTEAYFKNLHEFLNEFDETPQHQYDKPRHVAFNFLIENGYLYTKHACFINSQQLQALLALVSKVAAQRRLYITQIIDDLFDDRAYDRIPSKQKILPGSEYLRDFLATYYWQAAHPYDICKILSAITLHNTRHPEDPIELTLQAITLMTHHILTNFRQNLNQRRDTDLCIKGIFLATPVTQWHEIMRLELIRNYLLHDECCCTNGPYQASISALANPNVAGAATAARQAWYMHCYTTLLAEHTPGDSQTAKQQLEQAEDRSALIAVLREQLKDQTGANKIIAEEIRTQLKSYTPFFLQHPESLLMYLRYQFARVLSQQQISYSTGGLLSGRTDHSEPATIHSKLTVLLTTTLTKMVKLGTQVPNTTQEGIEQHQAICDATHETQIAIPRTLLDPLTAPNVIDNTRLQLCLRYISGEDPERQPVQAQAVAFDTGMAASATALPAFSAVATVPTGHAVASGPGVAAPGSALAAATSATPMSAAAPPPAGKR